MTSFNHMDAVRIQATKVEDEGEGQIRRFSVDPQLTNFDILRNLIGRAFDMNGDFNISYRIFDDYGGETFLSLVSDWDLNAAFVSASNPDLKLLVKPKIIPQNLDLSNQDEPWEIIRSLELSNASQSQNSFNSSQQESQKKSEDPVVKHSFQNPQAVSSPQYNVKFNHTGIFNTMERWVQKAKTFVEDISVVSNRPPLSDVEFRNYLDPAGVLCRPKELRFACYHGGVEPSLRKVVWKHLLNVYPAGLSGTKRIEYIRNKAKEYYDLRDIWKNLLNKNQVSENAHYVSSMVRKDVLRTDRHLKFFAGHDDNPNIESLFNILTTYSLNHPSVGYCQGMSDLASPLLVTMGDEAQAYICFCSLMDRIKPNFNTDGIAMSLKFAHLAEALAHYDPFFWDYLKSIGADDLLFCYRWLLLELKREFAFDDALRMMEVLWASQPYKPQDVILYEEKYCDVSARVFSVAVPNLTPYSKVCAIRRFSIVRKSNGVQIKRSARRNKENPNLSLDDNSLSSLSSTSSSSLKSTQKAFYSLDDTMEILSSCEFLTSYENSSNQSRTEDILSSPPKLVKNLKEFWIMTKANKDSEEKLEAQPDETIYVDKDANRISLTNGTLDKAKEIDFNNRFESKKDDLTSISDSSESFMLHENVNGSDPNKNVHAGNLPTQIFNDEKLKVMENSEDLDNDSGHGCSESIEIIDNKFIMSKIPKPEEFGGSNPFLMFLSLTLLLHHRDHIIKNNYDYNETAMYFDKLIRKHNVVRVLANARQMYSNYLKQNNTRA